MNTITTAATTYAPPSTSVVHNAQVSLTDRSPASVVHLVQYDDTLPIVAVALTANGQAYTVPAGAAVNVRMKKPDGTYVYNPALGISENAQTAYIAVTPQMAAASGKASPIIEIVVDGSVAATGTFTMVIDENPVPESAIESTDEFLTIQQILVQVQAAAKIVSDNEAAIQAVADNVDAIQQAPTAAANAAASATLAESWAVGGTGTREGENTNNAQYWCNQAQTIAQGALGWYETEEALQAAHPTGQNGQWAIVGTTDTIWTWDRDTSAWVNSGAQSDLSNYYTIPQANARFEMPIGFIFQWLAVEGQSVDLTTPENVAAYFGYGTWQVIAQGRFLIGQSSTYAAGSTGGEAEVYLTDPQQNAPHTHIVTNKGGNVDTGAQWRSLGVRDGSAPTETNLTTTSSGGGKAHNNIPPYLAVYTWQRIA